MTRVVKSKVILISFSTCLCFSSCKVLDSFHFTVNNNSNTSFILASSELGNLGVINENSSKEFRFWNRSSFITLDFIVGNSIKKYIFRDVDHWFGVIHRIEINVSNEAIEFTGTRNERFDFVD